MTDTASWPNAKPTDSGRIPPAFDRQDLLTSGERMITGFSQDELDRFDPAEKIELGQAIFAEAQAVALAAIANQLQELVAEVSGLRAEVTDLAEEVSYVTAALERPWPVRWLTWLRYLYPFWRQRRQVPGPIRPSL
jgi:hypothetical protein